MPIKPSQILALLQAKRTDFTTYDQTALSELQQYRTALLEAAQLSYPELLKLLSSSSAPGAQPLEKTGEIPNWVIPFNQVWQSREQSLHWVRDRLMGIATFAVDGSQIFPSKDLSIPVALVQIGWFENLHLPTGNYEKDIEVDVLTPQDLKTGSSGDLVDRRVNMRRFEMEVERLITYIEDHANREDCLVFFDGSIVVTFAEAFDENTRDFYVQCVLKLLRASQKHRVPLVAYIDTSYAKDLTTMVQHLAGLPEARSVHDAQLLHKWMKWGDRTPLFLCQRAGILSAYQEQADQIAFTYCKAHEGYPVRLEFPRWVYEAGWLDRMMDWVRGEVIIGTGYPYVIETADQTAVLQGDDRQMFYRLFQDWAENEDLKLRLSRKMTSKIRRR